MAVFVLIEALTFGLGRLAEAAAKYDIALHLLTRDKSVYAYELAHLNDKNLKLVETDTFNRAAVLDYCRKAEGFAGIINLTDTWAEMACGIAAELGCAVQNAAAVALCRDKFKLRNLLAEQGLSQGSAACLSVAEFSAAEAETLSYPLIVKDPAGTGSKNVWFAENSRRLAEIAAHAKQHTPLAHLLAETYFKGTLYSAETLSYRGKTKFLAASSRVLSDMPFFREEAISLPLATDSPELAGVEDWVSRVLAALSYTDGFAHTEFIVTAAGFEVVEVNPRLGGVLIGESLCQAYGCNIYEAFIEMALQTEPKLLRTALAAQCCVGQALVYAKQTGQFSHMDTQLLDAEKTAIFPCAPRGRRIHGLYDQSACVAILLRRAASSELALLNVLSERNKAAVTMEGEPQS